MLTSSLRLNESIRISQLGNNNIGTIGVRSLAYSLYVNKKLEYLDLLSIPIGNTGANEISSSLIVNQTLQTLYLNEDRMTEQGEVNLLKALEINSSLDNFELDLGDINSSIKSLEFICERTRSLDHVVSILCVLHSLPLVCTEGNEFEYEYHWEILEIIDLIDVYCINNLRRISREIKRIANESISLRKWQNENISDSKM